jgi:hypothetical protein
MSKSLLFLLSSMFTFNCIGAQPPTISSFSPVSGSVGTLVTISGTHLNGTTVLNIGGVAALPIKNTGTQLVAMVMPGATTSGIAITTADGSIASSSNFAIVASTPPNAALNGKLVGTGSPTNSNAAQGFSVAISADGSTAIVGGQNDNGGQGAAWIYTNNGGIWSQQGSKLVGTGNVGAAKQGYSVAISADGNTAMVGGGYDNNMQGAVWVYTRTGTTWTQQGEKLIGTGVINYAFQGCSISLSADGNTAVIGGNRDNNAIGAAWIFVREGNVWTQQGSKLIGTGNFDGMVQQGISVAISADGNTVAVGANQDFNNKGAVWVYKRNASTWTQEGSKLVGSGAIAESQQGSSVALSADGNTLLVGAHGDQASQGAAWIYARSGSAWTQQGSKLLAVGGTGSSNFGKSVTLSADGNTAIIGASADNNGEGAAWVYTRIGNVWAQQPSKLFGTGVSNLTTGAGQGYSVSLSADGNTAIVGGPNDFNHGAAWVFKYASALPTTITSLQAFQKNTSIQVEWNTKNETNLSSYEVEKSSNGSSFSKAGTVIAKGLSTYNWLDASPTNGSNYYRLNMMDKDGSFKYSSIVNVKIGGIRNVFTIAGNPIKNNSLILQMENVDKGSYSLSIYNNAGQLMTNRTIIHEGGSATQTVHLNNVPAGAYQLNIVGSNTKATKTIMVE